MLVTTGQRLTRSDTSNYTYEERLVQNDLRRLFYLVAGSARKYYALPAADRKVVRATAQTLGHYGHSYTLAAASEDQILKGFVYVIHNDAWKDSVKIGRAYDPQKRLRCYQTSSPHRDYKMHFAMYFNDCRNAEAIIHDRLADYRMAGEWFRMDKHEAQEAIEAQLNLNN